MKIIIYLFVLTLLFCSCDAEKTQKIENTNLQTTADSTISLVVVGDVMLGSNYPSAGYLPKHSEKLLFIASQIISNADVSFCNLEGCLLDSGGVRKDCDDSSSCYAFRQPTKTANILKNTGFDIISIANNHTNDFGKASLESTKETLAKNNFCFAGLPSKPIDTLTVRGIKIGFTAFSANDYTLKINDYGELEKQVKYLKSICQIVIVSFHGGAEGNSKRHISFETEIFLEENRGNVNEFAHKAIDYGADLVVGHGPHVIRAAELYKGKFIAYSLGNFCTYGTFNLSGHCGNALLLNLKLTKNGNFVSAKAHSFQQKKFKSLLLDSNQKAYKDLQELTNSDFPNTGLLFKPDGLILKK